jgi:hypothetical protein
MLPKFYQFTLPTQGELKGRQKPRNGCAAQRKANTKRLIQSVVAVAVIGLLAICVWQASCAQTNARLEAAPTGRRDACPTMTASPYQEQSGARLTEEFLNQLTACSTH